MTRRGKRCGPSARLTLRSGWVSGLLWAPKRSNISSNKEFWNKWVLLLAPRCQRLRKAFIGLPSAVAHLHPPSESGRRKHGCLARA